jgi:hypothetical protein
MVCADWGAVLVVGERAVHAVAPNRREERMAEDLPQDGLVAVVKSDCPTCAMAVGDAW